MSFFNHLNFEPEPEPEPEPQQPQRDADLSDEQATRLLSIGVRGTRRPVDELIECLGREAGQSWFERVIETFLRQAAARPAEALLDGSISIDELRRAKSAAKRGMQQAIGPEEAAGATALYFCAVAAALAHHEHRITSRSDEDLLPALADLADAVPERWRPMFEQALAR